MADSDGAPAAAAATTPTTAAAAAAADNEPPFPSPTTRRLKLVSWNVASLPSLQSFVEREHGSMAAFLAALGCDVFCVQETKLTPAGVKRSQVPFLLPDGWLTYWSVGTKTKGYCGVATYIKAGSVWSPLAVYTDAELLAEEADDQGELGSLGSEGRLVVTEHVGKVALFATYVPNAGQDGRPRLGFKIKFIEALYRQMEDYRARGWTVVLCGDLNMVAHPEADEHSDFLSGPEVNKDGGWAPEELRWFDRALGRVGQRDGPYVDTFRHLRPEARGIYTFWDQYRSHRASNKGLRIDYVLVSRDVLTANGGASGLLAAEVLASDQIKFPKASDHAAVMAELALPAPAPSAQEEAAAAAAVGPSIGCVKHKVEGTVILRHVLPDKAQKSIRSFFTSKPKAQAAAAAAPAAAAAASPPTAAATEAAAATTTDMEEEDGPAAKKQKVEPKQQQQTQQSQQSQGGKGKGKGKTGGSGLYKYFGEGK